MGRITLLAVLVASAAAIPASTAAQVGMRASTAAPDNEAIVVQGQRKKEVVQALKNLIQPTGDEQLARFEDKICPMVVGMPRDWTAKMTRMIRENMVAVGAEVQPAGCKPTALAIFIDQPKELVSALHEDAPFFFNMTPRQFKNFEGTPGPVWSWHMTSMVSRDGVLLGSGGMAGNDFAVVKNAAATRLYSNVRQDMQAGFVVIDRTKTVGTTLRQLADLATMHLLLDVRWDAGARDRSSILSLFHPRENGEAPPARFSSFDRGALAGFYTQRENNRSAVQQRENIATAIRKGAGEDKKD